MAEVAALDSGDRVRVDQAELETAGLRSQGLEIRVQV